MKKSPSAPARRPTALLLRRLDLWLWRAFGHGARLARVGAARRRLGPLTSLLTAVGVLPSQ